MKIHCTPVSIFAYSMILCLQAVEGAEIPKLFNNIALNLAGSWNGGVVPGPSDVGLWNDVGPAPVTAVGSLSPLGADLAIGGIKVTNVGGTRNLATNYVGYHSANSANTLTIGANGIDCSAALQTFFTTSKITIGADQSWIVANANTNGSPAGFNNNEDLCFQGQVTGGVPFNFGGKTVTTSGLGQITIGSGYTLSNGTLAVGNNQFVIQGGSNRVTSTNADLNLVVNAAGTLRIQSNSGISGASMASASPVTVNNAGFLEYRMNNDAFSMIQSGNITLNAGSTLSFLTDSAGVGTVSGGVVVSGATTLRTTGTGNPANGNQITGNLSGTGTINYQNTASGAGGHINLTGTNSGFTGTVNINGASGNRRLRISNANSGSAAATWNVAANNTLQVNGISTQLGTLAGAGAVTNSSATSPVTLNVGAGSFSGVISDNAAVPGLTGLNKIGAGKLELSGANTYSGPTTVLGGQLVVSTFQTPFAPADFTLTDAATLTVAQAIADTTLLANQLTIGASTGGTFEIALGNQTNPNFAPVSATSLQVNGANTLLVSGTNLSVGNTFPLIQYGGSITGTSGFGGLTLKLPARTAGTLSNVAGVIGVKITSTQQIKWNGNLSDNWDIDPDGTATAGTANWKTTVSGTATRYLQGTGGTDVVTFDNSATGTGTVNLTTALSPLGITVSNTTKAYTFTGTGKITGATGITKSGSGTLTLANTTPNDYIGITNITEGTLRLGDGTTAGGGSISSAITNDGTLVLNRPDDFTFTNVLSGSGTLEKAAANTVTLGNTSLFSPVVLTAGKLLFNSGGVVSGALSGSGQLQAGGGTLSLQGFDPNTNTGLVTVSAGVLRLEKSPAVNAVGGDITITGTGLLNIISSDQIPDTATVTMLGSSTDCLTGSLGAETFANAVVNGTVDCQMILRNTITITGTGTVTQGILGVGSSNVGNIQAIVLNSPTAMIRIAGNTGNTTLNVGAGGITASAGDVQVKYNGSNFDSVLNLAGGVTTTGNLSFSNGGYTGASLNIINLADGAHAFNIAAATTTTVAPDIGSTGSLVKSGGGTLTLNASCVAAHTGGTSVNEGTLLVNGSLQGATTVAALGTVGGTGTLAGATTVNGTVAPGVTAGKLTTTAPITLTGGSKLAIDIGNWAGSTAGTDWDLLAADTLALTATSGSKLTIRIAGTPTGFTETAKTLAIATSTNPLTGFDLSAIAIDATGFSGAGTWTVQQTGNSLELVYAPSGGSPYTSWATANGLDGTNSAPGLDPDKDGVSNFLEFALNGNPLSGTASGKVLGKVAIVGGVQALTLTIPVRSAAAFAGATEQTLTVDGLTYHIQGSDALSAWDLIVSEVTGADASAIQSTMPALQTGWFYRTFRSPGPILGDPADFLRVRVDSTN
jgi:autotransporter-associated beta strand protein